ncbi:ATP-dependent DNA helicase [Pseudovirgaria hyperparasitica]|uniref:ATP-dependent DNA helicase n=1 Tax=Pseudovirgaria hyperparasitica TaxID=470096 RepID=A0A6A6VYT8_9PEZI|nr:ATP-dependent DNA helicase [Pseudovirgaria hyperparasitica]KAF2754477.1 ATP-dependent DNA helicase [Pseudovirgaria hyperparasitica]
MSSGDEADLLNIDYSGAKRKFEPESPIESKRSCKDFDDTSTESLARTVARDVLRQRFGMEAFRLQQERAITRLLEGDSCVIIFPTGGGKSLCYQIPALCFKILDTKKGERQGPAEQGITLVVSPLIALMKDQVDALRRRGISAAVLDSTKSREEYLATVDSMRNGTLDILYCAPERLNNEGFVASMANVRGGVRLLAVDEAHCISEWGHSFRPDYLKIARFYREIHAERVVCLTATATPAVADDVRRAFDIPEAGLFRTSTYRSNLHLYAQSYMTKKESYPQLRAFLKAHPGSTIIYVTLQKQAEELADQLRSHKFKTRHFHAGLRPDEKTTCQEAFMASKDMVVVATIAFGMGIDKADIRNVIHYAAPSSLESYSQEIGRAGRDGKVSHCLLFLCADDLHLRESFARGDLPSKSSVARLLREVLSLKPSAPPENHIEANLYQQGREFDIKANALGNIYAQLELRFDLLRATTPKYTKYSYKQLKNTDWDKSPAATALRKITKKAISNHNVDMESAYPKTGMPRAELISKLNAWNDENFIQLTAGGVVNVFRVSQPSEWPPNTNASQEIIDALYKDMEMREVQELKRMDQVVRLISDKACFSRKLAEHFGDSLPGNAQECGHCTWCETHKAVEQFTPPGASWDGPAFLKVLEACPERDDPRYLARVAFGIGSPRVTMAKLSKSSVFGSVSGI